MLKAPQDQASSSDHALGFYGLQEKNILLFFYKLKEKMDVDVYNMFLRYHVSPCLMTNYSVDKYVSTQYGDLINSVKKLQRFYKGNFSDFWLMNYAVWGILEYPQDCHQVDVG